MANTYIKPETKTVKVETQHMMAGSLTKDGTTEITNNNDVLSKGFDFFTFEEEEVPGKSDDDDWEEWEDEEDP